MSREIEVWADWRELGAPTLMGTLRSSPGRGKEVFPFSCDPAWLFSIAVHNTDDHLRNHGFLLTENGWILSPAFDLNPHPEGTGLSLNISESDNALDFELALEVAPLFRLDSPTAAGMLRQVREAVSPWRRLARSLGIPPAEQDLTAPAFEI
jgi:serine/threonine-protein kinase HipA